VNVNVNVFLKECMSWII